MLAGGGAPCTNPTSGAIIVGTWRACKWVSRGRGGDWARGKQRGFSPRAAARHSQSARARNFPPKPQLFFNFSRSAYTSACVGYMCCSVCCIVLQCVAVCCSVLQCVLQFVAVCCRLFCRVLQCIAVCCYVLRCVAEIVSVLPCVAVCVAVCCSVLLCVAVYCSVLQCVAVVAMACRLYIQAKPKSQKM